MLLHLRRILGALARSADQVGALDGRLDVDQLADRMLGVGLS
jgi:hypothetical protein